MPTSPSTPVKTTPQDAVDIAAAKKVGCISVGKRHEFNLQAFKDISPDFSIVNFNELNAVLTR